MQAETPPLRYDRTGQCKTDGCKFHGTLLCQNSEGIFTGERLFHPVKARSIGHRITKSARGSGLFLGEINRVDLAPKDVLLEQAEVFVEFCSKYRIFRRGIFAERIVLATVKQQKEVSLSHREQVDHTFRAGTCGAVGFEQARSCGGGPALLSASRDNLRRAPERGQIIG